MTLEMQVKKLLGINAVQNIMAKFQYYYTVSDYNAIGKLFYESDTTSAEVPGGKYVGIQEVRTKAFGGFPGGPMPKPEGGEGKPEAPEGEAPKGPAGPVNMGGGRLQIHTLTTPLVEVADDCKTAKALWMSPGLETGGHVGDLAGSWAWEKFYVEFICEDDKWYIWHFHQIDILCSFFYKSWTDDFFTHSLMHVPEEFKTFDQKWEFINQNNRSGNPLTKTYFYDQEIAPFMDVALPEPYETY
jgi:hypothetical protein